MFDQHRGHGDPEILGAGTDLFLSLFSVMVCVYAIMVGMQAAARKAAEEAQAETVQISVINDDLLAQCATLQRALKQLEHRYANLRSDSQDLHASLDDSLQESEVLRQEVDRLEDDLSSRSDSEATLNEQLEQLHGRFVQLSETLKQEQLLRQDLLDVRGKLDRVVFLVDRSASMQQGERWEQARQTIEKWMLHLPVKEAALVVFNQQAYCYPRDRSFLPVNSHSRHRLINKLRQLRPEGGTGTLIALQQAYNYADLDTIVLFTDGKPSDPEDSIHAFIESQEELGVVINAVALGSYSDKQDTFEFLTALARKTGGSYRGR